MKPEEPGRGQIWTHTKTGGIYKILFRGKDEESGDDVVIYRSIDHKKYPTVWVRKLEVFMGVVPDQSAGNNVPRFQRLVCDR